MAIKGIEVDQVGEDEIAVLSHVHGVQRLVEKLAVAGALQHLGDALMGEDVGDLAHTDDLAPFGGQPVQKGGLGRQNRVVAPVGSAHKVCRSLACERPGDDAADVVRIRMLARHLAQRIEPFEAEGLLMGGDLHHGIRRGVEDRLAGAQVLFTQFRNHFRAGGMLVADDAGNAGFRHDGGDHLRREGGDGGREIAPVELNRHARDFPVAGRGVLAVGHFRRIAPKARGGRVRRKAGQGLAGGQRGGGAKAEAVHVGQMQRPAAQARLVTFSGRTALRDMAQRVGALIAEAGGILRTADAKTVEHNENGARHALFPFVPRPKPLISFHGSSCGCLSFGRKEVA